MANVISLFLSMSRIGDLQGSLSISIQHCCLRVSLISLQSPLSAPTFLDPLFSYSYFSFGSGCYSLWLYLLQSIHLDCWQRLHHIATYCLQNCQQCQCRDAWTLFPCASMSLCCAVMYNGFIHSPSSDPGILMSHGTSLVKHIILVFACCYLSQEFWSQSIGIRMGN